MQNRTPSLVINYKGPLAFNSTLAVDHNITPSDTVTIIYPCEAEKDTPEEEYRKWATSDCGIWKSPKEAGTYILGPSVPKDQRPAPDLLRLPVSVKDIPGDAGQLRVAIGEYLGSEGPVLSNEMVCWDIHMQPGHEMVLNGKKGDNALLFVFQGELVLENDHTLSDFELGIFAQKGDDFKIKSNKFTKGIFISGNPIDEPSIGFDLL